MVVVCTLIFVKITTLINVILKVIKPCIAICEIIY